MTTSAKLYEKKGKYLPFTGSVNRAHCNFLGPGLQSVLKDIKDKPQLEAELKNGLRVQAELKQKEKAFATKRVPVEASLEQLVKEAEKATSEVAKARSKLDKMEADHKASIEESQNDIDYRSEEALDCLAARLEQINTAMETIRDVIKE